jgi:hypothetical protein
MKRSRMYDLAMDPEVPTFRELGYNWVDGAYRGGETSGVASAD